MNKYAIIIAVVLTLIIISTGVGLVLLTNPKGPRILVVPDQYKTITAAMEKAKSGDTVFLKPGIYQEEKISVKGGVKLVGEHMDKVIIQYDVRKHGKACAIVAPEPNSLIKDLTVEHMGKILSERRPSGIFIADAPIEIVHCTIRKSNGYGLAVKNSRSIIRDCTFENNGFGGIIVTLPGSYPTIQNCTIAHNMQHGIFFEKQTGGILENNTIEQNGWDGISITGEGETVILRKNLCASNGGNGIYVENGAKLNAEDNTCRENGGDGIYIKNPETLVTLKQNRCVKNNRYGISFHDKIQGVVEDNICSNNRKENISFSKNETIPVLESNQCSIDAGEN